MTTCKLLIVDDDQWWIESMIHSLGAAGFTISSAPHGLAAIERISDQLPDIILLDIFLPGPNGLALIHELRSHQDLAAIPLVVLSSMVSGQTGAALSAYGVKETLDKSVATPETIAAALRKALL